MGLSFFKYPYKYADLTITNPPIRLLQDMFLELSLYIIAIAILVIAIIGIRLFIIQRKNKQHWAALRYQENDRL